MAGLLQSPWVRPTILIETPQNPSPEVNLELQRHFTDDSRKIRVLFGRECVPDHNVPGEQYQHLQSQNQ
jgi:hypothetical protein